MKAVCFFLLLGLLCALEISARNYHTKRDLGDDSEEHHFGGDSESQDGDGHDEFACYMGIMMCAEELQQKYEADNVSVTVDNLRDTGLNQVCTDLTEAGSCMINHLVQPTCKGVPVEVRDMMTKANGFLTFVCVNKLNEIKDNWKCLTSQTVEKEVDGCSDYDQSLAKCQPDAFLACVKKVIDGAGNDCQPGAYTLVSEITEELMKVIPCNKNSSDDEDEDDDNYQVKRGIANLWNQFMKRK